MDVGFIGLGEMGCAMAGQLLKAGHTVRAWNRSSGPAEALADQGVKAITTPDQAFVGDAAVTMLADDRAVRAVILEGDLLARAPKGFVHVVCSTISVAFSKELEEAHRKRGVGYVAAPVLGRPDVASAGALNILAGGEASALAKVQPLLDAMGKRTWLMGDEPHKASAAKVGINFMLAAAIESTGEAMALVDGHGVDSAQFLEVLTNTLFSAPVFKVYGPLIVERKFTPAGFKAVHGLKDVKLALAASEEAGVPLPIGGVLRDNLIDVIANAGPEVDWAALGGLAFRRAGKR